MAGWLVVSADFLLDPRGPGFPQGALDQEAAAILRGLRNDRRRVALVSTEPAEVIKHWAQVRGHSQWDGVLGSEESLLDAAKVLRDQQGGVDLVLAGNPGDVRGLLMHGFRVVSLATPVYTRDEHRPDYEATGVRPWSEVAAQHDGDLAMHAEDPRRDSEAATSGRFTE